MEMKRVGWAAVAVIGLMFGINAFALDLDWSGQFRAESHWINNYALDHSGTSRDVSREGAGGYYIPGGGAKTAAFQSLFLRLRPRLVVNDNVYIKSEWWLGDPVFGFFGDAQPYGFEQRQYNSTFSRGSSITAQRFWAEILTDIGTLQLGRAPLHWGLGLFWHSGDGVWDRYQSTGDQIRLISKFGAFTFSPALVKYGIGNSIGGSCTFSATGGPLGGSTCNPTTSGSGLVDYSLMFKYENVDEDFEGGVNFVKRILDDSGETGSGYFAITPAGATARSSGAANYNVWSFYGKKKLGRFTFSGEVPLTTGDVNGMDYRTYAVALEGGVQISDQFETRILAGHAPGQPAFAGNKPQKYRAFYFNPNYRLGMIMFNYQLASFAGPNTLNNTTVGRENLLSPFDNPIVNANYVAVNGTYKLNKWRFNAGFIYAKADETAASGEGFMNTWRRSFHRNNSGLNQESSLGWELDLGTSLQWDDNLVAGLDLGLFVPGSYFRFTNLNGQQNAVSTVLGAAARVGITF